MTIGPALYFAARGCGQLQRSDEDLERREKVVSSAKVILMGNGMWVSEMVRTHDTQEAHSRTASWVG